MDQATRCRTVVILLFRRAARLLNGVDPRAFARLQVQESGQVMRNGWKSLVRPLARCQQRHPTVHRGDDVRERIRGSIEVPHVCCSLVPGLAPSGGEVRAVQADRADRGA